MWHQCTMCKTQCNASLCNYCSEFFRDQPKILRVKLPYKILEECCVCFDITLDMTPCNHAVCKECISMMTRCPLCRSDMFSISQDLCREIYESLYPPRMLSISQDLYSTPSTVAFREVHLRDVELIMSHMSVTRERATSALVLHDGDIVNAMMYCMNIDIQ